MWVGVEERAKKRAEWVEKNEKTVTRGRMNGLSIRGRRKRSKVWKTFPSDGIGKQVICVPSTHKTARIWRINFVE